MNDPPFDYEEKKARELEWHLRGHAEKAQGSLIRRLVHHPLIFDIERNAFNYNFPKQQMAALLWERLGEQKAADLLLAPCGKGGDLPFLRHVAHAFHGIDLSPVAVGQCPPEMRAKEGDILDSGYADGAFDAVASPLFFHHLLNVGFAPFLEEFHRIMKPGAQLVILEPCLWYPLNIITRPLKHLLGNPMGEVEDEGPFSPGLLVRALEAAGFADIEWRGASFSHPRFYKPMARFVNRVTKPLLTVRPFRTFAWTVAYAARRP